MNETMINVTSPPGFITAYRAKNAKLTTYEISLEYYYENKNCRSFTKSLEKIPPLVAENQKH